MSTAARPDLPAHAEAVRLPFNELVTELRAILGARLVAYLQRRAEGNAFFVTELLRTLEEQGALREDADGWRVGDLSRVAVPMLLRQVIDGRAARLGEETRHLLTVAAVIGRDVAVALCSSSEFMAR